MSLATTFRELHAPGRLLRLPNPWDAGRPRPDRSEREGKGAV